MGMEPRAFVIHTICFTFDVRFKHTSFLSPERQGRGPECCSTFSAAGGGSRSSVLSPRLLNSARLFCPGLNLFPMPGKFFIPSLTDPTDKWHPLRNWVWPHKTKCTRKGLETKPPDSSKSPVALPVFSLLPPSLFFTILVNIMLFLCYILFLVGFHELSGWLQIRFFSSLNYQHSSQN